MVFIFLTTVASGDRHGLGQMFPGWDRYDTSYTALAQHLITATTDG